MALSWRSVSWLAGRCWWGCEHTAPSWRGEGGLHCCCCIRKRAVAGGGEGLGDDANVGQYVYKRIVGGLQDDLPEDLRHEITRYLLKLPGNLGLREIKKQAGKDKLPDIQNIVASKSLLLKQAIQPVENIVHDFSVEILRGLESVFIVDTGKEIARQREELSKAVGEITELGPENPKAMEVLQVNLNKIKDFLMLEQLQKSLNLLFSTLLIGKVIISVPPPI